MLRSDQWPMIAAHLLALGFDGEPVVELAGLTSVASGWEIDQLVPAVLQEIGAPELSLDEAATVVARVLAQASNPALDHPITRTLAALAPRLDYPSGLINTAFANVEWLDPSFHQPFRADSDRFESELRALSPLDLPRELADALVNR